MGLTATGVIDAALRMSRGTGLNSWTIRDLAAELDVAPSVIYHHVGGRDVVVRGVVERLVRDVRPPSPSLPWKGWFREFLYGVRPVAVEYPGVAKWLLMHGPTFPGISTFFDRGLAVLLRAGFEQPAMVYTLLVNSAILTFTMGDDRREVADDGPRDHATMLRAFTGLSERSVGVDRLITEVLGPLAGEPGELTGDEVNERYYRLLVESLLAGLEAGLDTETAASDTD